MKRVTFVLALMSVLFVSPMVVSAADGCGGGNEAKKSCTVRKECDKKECQEGCKCTKEGCTEKKEAAKKCCGGCPAKK